MSKLSRGIAVNDQEQDEALEQAELDHLNDLQDDDD